MPNPRTYCTDELLRHAGWLRRVAVRLVGEVDAADQVQATWLAALRHRPHNPGPWLRRVLHNHAVSDVRRRSRARTREIAHARSEALPSTSDLAAHAEMTGLLLEAVLRLKPAQRDVILLRYFDELPHAAIAHRLGMPPATVRSHLARGLEQLRHDLDAAAGGDRDRWMRALAPFASTTLSTTNASASASLLLTALSMTSTQKIAAGTLLAIAFLALASKQLGILPSEPPAVAEEPRAALEGIDRSETPLDHGSVSPTRTPVDGHAITDPPRVPTQRIRVVHAATGASVPHATVLYCKSGFVWDELDARSKEEHSLMAEVFLQKHGETKTADENGIVQVPLAVASLVIVGRKGDLYGTAIERKDDAVWQLALSPHGSLVVELFDDLGAPVEGVRILCTDMSFANVFRVDLPLGTTDEHGRVTHLFQVPQARDEALESPALEVLRKRLTVFASLPGGKHGEFAFDPADPPRQPVRIILPATGTVSVLVLDPAGNYLDPATLGDPNVEITVADPAVHEVPGPMRGRQIATIAADGYARFSNVVCGKTLSVSAPTLLGKIEFAGPSADRRDVLVEHRMHADHPVLTGRLVSADRKPVPNTQFGIMCRGDGFLTTVGVRTDDKGWFTAYLPESAMGKQAAEVSAFLDWQELSPDRTARVLLSVPLTGIVQLGNVVVP